MSRYSVYIDGLNVYHSLDNWRFYKYKWLNYRKLAETLLRPEDSVVDIFYFTTYARWKPQSFARHKQYIKVLRSVKITDVQGRFMDKEIQCHLCKKLFWTHEEKQTDVNIALYLLADVMNDVFDRAVIISGDTDLVPVIEMVHKLAPDKEIGVIFPLRRYHNSLRKAADFTITMKESILESCQFPDEVTVGTLIIKKPDYWR